MMEVDKYKVEELRATFPYKLCMTMESGQSTSLSCHTYFGSINHCKDTSIQTSKADASIQAFHACLLACIDVSFQ